MDGLDVDWQRTRSREGLVRRVLAKVREAWVEYLSADLGFAVLPEERPRHPQEPRIWIANGWGGYGADGGASGRIGRWLVVADWRVPGWLQGRGFLKRDDWEPEWL